jgi:hypothetical protein
MKKGRSWLRSKVRRHSDPWLKHELYVERLVLIEHFSNNPGFKLFGRGWDEAVRGMGSRFDESIARVRQGPLASGKKLSTVAGFRFSLCLENTIFPGYVTEKIFDSLRAGAVPIYLGAPDIETHVPNGVFIDYRAFSGPAELDQYLQNISAAEERSLVDAGQDFLSSRVVQRFTKEYFGASVMEEVRSAL